MFLAEVVDDLMVYLHSTLPNHGCKNHLGPLSLQKKLSNISINIILCIQCCHAGVSSIIAKGAEITIEAIPVQHPFQKKKSSQGSHLVSPCTKLSIRLTNPPFSFKGSIGFTDLQMVGVGFRVPSSSR